MARLGLGRPQKLASHRRVEEQVLDADGSPFGPGGGDGGRQLASHDLHFGGRAVLRGAAADLQAADRADGGQGLTAKAERADAKQIFVAANLAGGMAGHGQRQFLGRDAAAVVHHANALYASFFEQDVYAVRAGVDGVFHQLLHDAGWSFHDLACGDLVDDVGR